MARIVIEHNDFRLTFHCPKLAKVLQKANHNGLTVAGGQLYSHYSWTGDVLSVNLEEDSGDEKVDPSVISNGGHAQVEHGAPFFFDNTVYPWLRHYRCRSASRGQFYVSLHTLF